MDATQAGEQHGGPYGTRYTAAALKQERSQSAEPSGTSGTDDGEPSAASRAGRRLRSTRRRARGLGWFSVGLGLTQLLAPRVLAKAIGLRDDPWMRRTMRLLGARELAAGLGILGTSRPTGWLWSRVAGDGMDLALLTTAMALPRRDGERTRLSGAMAAVAGVTALDILTSVHLQRAKREGLSATLREPVTVTGNITVNKPAAEMFGFWRDFTNLARFMTNVSSVEVLDAVRSRWTVQVAGKNVTWEAEITEERAPELIAWRTRAGSTIAHQGEVRFVPAPRGQGTEIHVRMQVTPPGGWFGRTAARVGKIVPEQEIALDLGRLKQLLETGEVMRSDASIHRGPHPARPAAIAERKGGER